MKTGVALKEYLKEKREQVDKVLDDYLPKADMYPKALHQAIRYSLFAGGKRIRSILCIASCEAVGGDADAVLPAASAIELVHTYSLIHDDLPAMDNDDFRRGRPTNHKVYGESIAILAGDALLTSAFNMIADKELNNRLDPDTLITALKILAVASGSLGMVGGQAADIQASGKDVDLPDVEYIHTHKTGALILASVRIGAVCGGASDSELTALTRFGQAVGLAFQIVDDILDIEGNREEIGKDVGSDIAKKKVTYPSVIGISESKKRASELLEMALDSVSAFDEKAEPLRQIAGYIIERRS
ncbi:MAG: polyprenyl synthetase family protein [Nitrospirota bacterium]